MVSAHNITLIPPPFVKYMFQVRTVHCLGQMYLFLGVLLLHLFLQIFEWIMELLWCGIFVLFHFNLEMVY